MYIVSILTIKDRNIINEIPASRPRKKRMIMFCTTIEKGIKNIFPSRTSFIVLKILDFIEYLLMHVLHRILLGHYNLFQIKL